MDDAQLNRLVHLDLEQSLFQCLHGTRDITLEDEVEGLDLAILESLGEVLEADALASLRELSVALGSLTLLRNLARGPIVIGHDEGVPCSGNTREALNRHGTRREGFLNGLAVLVDHGADTTIGSAGNNRFTHAERSRLDENRGNRTATLIQTGFDSHTAGGPVRISPEVQTSVCGEQDSIEKLGDTFTLQRRHLDCLSITAILLGNQTKLGQLLEHLVSFCSRGIHLVDGHHDGNPGCLRVVQSLNCLGHDAVIGGHHQNRDIGDLSSTGTHSGKGLVTGGINEGDSPLNALVLCPYLVSTDVLGDSPGLTGDNIRTSNRVQQLRLTVVNVTHDRHNRRSNDKIFVVFFLIQVDVKALQELFVFVLGETISTW